MNYTKRLWVIGVLQEDIKAKLKKIATEVRFSMFYDKVFPEIFRKAKEYDESISIPKKMTKKGYETAPNVSTYGATSWAEYFAESFANGVGGAPTAIGKATVDTIKDIFGGKLL